MRFPSGFIGKTYEFHTFLLRAKHSHFPAKRLQNVAFCYIGGRCLHPGLAQHGAEYWCFFYHQRSGSARRVGALAGRGLCSVGLSVSWGCFLCFCVRRSVSGSFESFESRRLGRGLCRLWSRFWPLSALGRVVEAVWPAPPSAGEVFL